MIYNYALRISINTIVCMVVYILLISTNINAQESTDDILPDSVDSIQESESIDDTLSDSVDSIQASDTIQDSSMGELIFSVKDDLNTHVEIVDKVLYKGLTLFWEVEENVRYAVIATSDTIDTLVRLTMNNISTYRDLYLGENAGIVFTSHKKEKVALTVFSTGRLDGTLLAKDYSNRTQSTETVSEILLDREVASSGDNTENSTEVIVEKNSELRTHNTITTENSSLPYSFLGEYLVHIYKIAEPLPKVNVPLEQENTLVSSNTLAHRVAHEYAVDLVQDTRVYVYMESSEFDTLLEVSDRFGRTVFSDDWGEGSSLITFMVPNTDEYFITATSFNGVHTGLYTLKAVTSSGEEIQRISGKITPASSKILQQYAVEHEITIEKGQYMTAEIQALDTSIEVAFVNEQLQAIHFTTIGVGDTKVIPLYAAEDENYKLLVLSNQKTVSNYLLTLYK